MRSINAQWRHWADALKRQIHALYLAARDPRVPTVARILVVAVVAYALSPIDLVPDFIPVIGYLDDLLLLPLGIRLAVRLVPPPVWQECRARAAGCARALPVSRVAAVVIVIVWLLAALAVTLWMYSLAG